MDMSTLFGPYWSTVRPAHAQSYMQATPLHIAAQTGKLKAVRLLLEHGQLFMFVTCLKIRHYILHRWLDTITSYGISIAEA
jgi:ankyrin repeat protein